MLPQTWINKCGAMRFIERFLILFLFCGSAWAATPEQLLLSAREAHAKRDEAALQTYARQLHAQNYLLAPYVDYWHMLVRLDRANAVEVRDFLSRYAEYPFSETIRIAWLKQLGRRDEWPLFFEELPRLEANDTAVQCLAVLGVAKRDGDRALAEGKSFWLTAASQPNECDPLFDRMVATGVLTEDEIWQRAHLALELGRVSLAKAALRRLPNMPESSLKYLDRVYENPQRALEKETFTTRTRLGRELNLFAVERVSRSQPELALVHWSKLRSSFSQHEQQALWARMAVHAARQHQPFALEWFGKTGDLVLSEEQVVWKARAALRTRQWPELLKTIDAMPGDMRNEDAWRYWKARALKQAGNMVEANRLLLPLSREHHYYGLLAEEELGDSMSAPPKPYKLSDSEIDAVAKVPGIQRALALYSLDFRWEARKEWNWAIQRFDDKQLLAAAELAFKQDQYDIAINTADKTELVHDFSLRYPTPYRDMMRAYVAENDLDEAWVYGLIRQESRFIDRAKSRVGASGLMQVMPATGKWIARRLGLGDYRHSMIYDTDTNIRFGTHYLRYTMDRAEGQPVIATAAYNAGPGRALRWRPSERMEGEIYAETIPFSETRDYVQKVMSNAYFYAQRLGARMQTLKQRMGQVGGAMTADDEAAKD